MNISAMLADFREFVTPKVCINQECHHFALLCVGNVAEASRLSCVARDTIYRHRKLIQQGGIELLKRQEPPEIHHKNRTDRAIEDVVIEFSLPNHRTIQNIKATQI